jgi:hypothetical protein
MVFKILDFIGQIGEGRDMQPTLLFRDEMVE